MRRLALFLLVLMVCAVFYGADTAVAGSGFYPDSPVQRAPANNVGGTTINFSSNSYYTNYYGYDASPTNYYIEIYQGGTLIYGNWTNGSTNFSVPGFQDIGASYTWRVLAYYEFYYEGVYDGYDYTNWSGYFSFTNGPSGPPAAPSVVNPYPGDNEGGSTVSFQWNPVTSADNYRLLVKAPSGAVFYDQWLGNYDGVDLTGFPDIGETYTWQVQAKNTIYTGPLSGTWSFTNGPSAVPSQPVQSISPPSGAGPEIVLNWSSARANDYHLQVATDPNYTSYFGGPIVDEWTGNYSGMYLNTPDDGTTIYWRVQAKNSLGTTAYSSSSFTNGPSAAPPAPTLAVPANGANAPGTQVLLEWTEAPRANDYQLQVATDAGFAELVFDEWVGDYVGVYLDFDDDGTTYYWRVAARNSLGSSPYSSAYFVNGYLDAPSLIIPFPGDNEGGGTVSFQWTLVAKADNYRLLVTSESGSVFFDQWLGDYDGVDLPGFPDIGGTYLWQVQAKKGDTTGPLSGTQSFINGPSAPPVPTQIIPLPDDYESGGTVSFQWSTVARANNYRLLITSEAGDVFYDQWLGDVDGIEVPGFPDVGGIYSWQVQAKSDTQTSPLSDPAWTFINGIAPPPDAPSLLSPVNGANVAGFTVTFSWSQSARADSYVIQVATDENFNNILGENVVEGATAVSLDGFGNVGTTYYWHVAGVKGVEMGPYSSYATFTNGMLNKSTELPITCMESAACSSTNVATGSLSHDQELFSAKGTAIQLFYNSLPSYLGSLGLNWSHTYDISLTENADGSVLLRTGSGGRSFYTKSGSNYISSPGDYSSLIKNVDNSYFITYRDGSKYNFRQDGKIASIVDRFNNTISFVYTNGDLTSITDPAYRTTTISYDLTTTPHRISAITDPNQKIYDFSYQGNTLWKVMHPAADPAISPERGYWEYQYDSQVQGLLKSKKDPNGNVSQYTYYADHKMEKAIDPEGNGSPDKHTRSYVYPTNSDNIRTTTFTEKDGGQWLYTFDAQTGVLKSKSDPNGKATTFTYYPNGSLKSTTEPKDGAVRLTTFYTYDSYGNVQTQTEPVDLNSYNPAIDPETVTDPSTLSSLIPPISPAFNYYYNNFNYDRIIAIMDWRGTKALSTRFTYATNNGGEVVFVIDPASNGTIIRHNPNGTVKEIVDANNTNFVGGRGLVVTEKTGATKTVLTYYPDTPENRTAGIVGLLENVTTPDGITTTIASYDKTGNPLEISLKDTAGTVRLTSSQQHDALNRLKQLTKITASLPNIITKYGYDFTGNLNSLIDAENRETRYEYNYNRQVKKITDAKRNDTIFTYSGSAGSGVDQLVGVYDANVAKNTPLDNQPHTSFTYDKLGRVEYETDQLNKRMHYTYYDNGLLKEKYDATASTPGILLASFVYNNQWLVTDKNFADGTSEHYTYYPDGKLWTASNQNISYTYVYYDDGRLHTITDTTNNRVISYDQYDKLGQRKQVTILKGAGADERVIGYDYDAANRPWHITSNAGTFTYAYDNLGRRDTLTYPNGTTADLYFDDLNRLTAITNKVTGGAAFAAFNYSDYDKVGNRKAVSGSKNETYGYDELYRLLTVTAVKSETFDYDAVGNRQSGPGAADAAYVPNAANQMTVGRKLGYTYDNFGNQTTRTVSGASDKSWVQTWDLQNRLVKVERTTAAERRTVTFKYDPLGRRIGKQLTTVIDGISKTETWSYVYDGGSIAVEIYTDESNTTTKTFYTQGPGVDEHLAMERGGQFYYYHTDGLGSVVTITDAAKTVVQSYEYDSYGMVTPSTAFRNSYTYTGREWDSEAGLYYYRARYYDPMEGRFIQKDPISILGNIYTNQFNVTFDQYVKSVTNAYVYTDNNPINYTDPLGLAPFDAQKWAQLTNSVTYYSTKYNDRLNAALNWVGGKIQGNALGVSPPSDFTRWTLLGLLAKEMMNPKELSDPLMDKNGNWRFPNGDPVQCRK